MTTVTGTRKLPIRITVGARMLSCVIPVMSAANSQITVPPSSRYFQSELGSRMCSCAGTAGCGGGTASLTVATVRARATPRLIPIG